ncbi:MAG: hypothetical protein K6B64_01255 [Acholeplasmatales bacterium]|nr:hypothetical protein [Acholeplasmatales bacterium]
MDKSVKKNFFFAFGAQSVSLASSLMMTFVAPSLVGVKSFAYWQLFLTYVSYVSITRIGINDGLYLRLGGKNYKDLDFKLLSCERRIFITFQFVVACFLGLIVCLQDIEYDRKFVLIVCVLCIIIVNANGYLIYILQSVNLTSIYSISVILQNTTWFIAIGIIIFLKIYDFKIIIYMYVLGHVLAGIYLAYNAKEIVKWKRASYKEAFNDIIKNIKCGIQLMISTYASSFTVASCRLIVDMAWGVEVFGFFSFSLTLANVFLTFISQISIIVFPALRRIPNNRIKTVYIYLNDILSIILPIVMLGYFPIMLLINYFLNQYSQSLTYLPIFLPICVFDGKMQMLCSSFFKSMRRETALLFINVGTLINSIFIGLLGAFYVKNISFVAIGILVIIGLRSIVSELLLAKWMNVCIYKELIQEILLIILFVIGCYTFKPVDIFWGYGIIYLIYLIINRKRIKNILNMRKDKKDDCR